VEGVREWVRRRKEGGREGWRGKDVPISVVIEGEREGGREGGQRRTCSRSSRDRCLCTCPLVSASSPWGLLFGRAP